MYYKQNVKVVDPRYFLKDNLLTEAPTRDQVGKLTKSLADLFGNDCEMGQSTNGVVFKGNGRYVEIAAVSGKLKELDMQPGSYRAGAFGAENCSYALLQNAEIQKQVLEPVIKRIFTMANQDSNVGEFSETELPLSIDERTELVKLRRENKKLSKEIKELKSKLYGQGGESDNNSGLEID
jgi:hypothetical protein